MKYILIINPFGIGDVLFSTAIIEAIGRQVEGCHIGFLCNRRTEAFLKNNPFIDWVFVFEKDEYRRLWRVSKIECVKRFFCLLRDIKTKGFDTVIDLSLSRHFGFMTWFLGIRRRAGFNYKRRGIFLTDKIDITGYDGKHIVEYYLALIELVGLKRLPCYLKLDVGDNDRRWAGDFLSGYGIKEGDLVIGIAPAGGASWGGDAVMKHWKKEYFADLADILARELAAKIVILGSAEEKDICDFVAGRMRNPSVNSCGKTNPLQFAALAGICNLVVANDGGPLHVAVAMGARTVGIFGPVDEKVYGQYPINAKHRVVQSGLECRPCYRNFKLKGCDLRKCLDDIRPEEVFKAACEVLKN